ncbi:MAG TPA: hypothetical protein VME45_03020 [Stellaceae bacterium]|nr:hypothetical protein [Stellaceae bacterium]
MTTIFLGSHHSHGVKPRAGASVPANTDDDPAGGATPIVLPIPTTDEQIIAATEQPHRPWIIQGMMHAL